MAGLERYQKNYKQRLGNDAVYGQGTDGDVTISSNTTLTSDKYYNNLTVNSGITLLTNGYRIFVKNTLTNNGYIGVGTVSAGEPSGAITSGTINGALTNTTITYGLGGTGAGGSTNVAPTWLVNNVERLLQGKLGSELISGDGLLYGGGAGTAGAKGNDVAGYTSNDNWTGKAGNAGGAGNYAQNWQWNGEHQSHATNHCAGNAGSPGNAGGGTGTGGAGGAGGVGGGVVLIFAKSITGTGTIFAKGGSGSAGATGTSTTAGNTGANGNTGHHTNYGHHHNCQHTVNNCKGACDHNYYYTHIQYDGGAGGTGGAGSPAVTGNTGETGYRGGGGGIVIVTDTTPSNQTYTVTAGSAGSTTTGLPTSGYSYIILNT